MTAPKRLFRFFLLAWCIPFNYNILQPHANVVERALRTASPMFDPLSLYRLSPLFALSSHLAQVQAQQSQSSSPLLAMDFKQTLDLLAERRALFEKLKSEATCSSPVSEASESTDSVPVDLSVK